MTNQRRCWGYLPVNELLAVFLYQCGVRPGVSTFVDEVTFTYGYGYLDDYGSWEFEVPHQFLNRNEPKEWHG